MIDVSVLPTLLTTIIPCIHLSSSVVSTAASFRETIHNSLSQPSVSAGIGLVYRFDPVRVEVNFAVPLIAARSDGLQRGFQAGIGLEFL